MSTMDEHLVAVCVPGDELVLHAEVDRRAFEHLVDGADGAHLATHGASAFGGGGGLLVALLAGDRVERALPHLSLIHI